MLCKEIIHYIQNELFPKEFCIKPEFYGFQYKSPTINLNTDFKKVLFTIDVDIDSIYYALKNKIRLILSHHFFFNKKLCKIDSYLSKKLSLLSNASMSVFSLGSSFIAAENGVSETICEKLFCEKDHPFEIKVKKRIIPIGRVCIPRSYKFRNKQIKPKSIKLGELIERAKYNFQIENLKYLGNLNTQISRICIIGGSFSKTWLLKKALEMECNCFVTGNFGNQQFKFAKESKLTLIEIPCYSAEIGTLKKTVNILNLRFPQDEVI
jgi:putative NIF3 family GTP cyclohydrolase 1 type 2